MPDVPYTIDGCIARMRVADSRTLAGGVRCIKEAIQQAAASGVAKMLVDIRDINVDPPTLAERHWSMAEWAAVGRGMVRVAVLVRPDFHDPEGYGAAVASSRGLQLRGFTEEGEALEWLADR